MKIYLGADHKGYRLKEHLAAWLRAQGHEVTDVGTDSEQSTDYPDYGLQVARAVAQGSADRGITICWTGNGMAIVANKVPGVRAGLALTEEMAMLTRAHNDANVLALPAKFVDPQLAEKIVHIFFATAFEGGRHVPRLAKIANAERS